MSRAAITVRAEWDDEASVWFATSDDIDGLALEAATMEELTQKVPGALRDLVELNGVEFDRSLSDIPYRIIASHSGHIANLAA